MPNYLINKITGLDKLSYLELGTYDCHHFNSILAKDKVGVDIAFNPTYKMTTDEFFRQINSYRQKDSWMWDVVFIDADHTATSVLRDFNNCVEHLKTPGVIFLHDLYPKDRRLTAPHFCGDAYKFLDALHSMNYPDVYVQTPPTDYGLTMILNPRLKVPAEQLKASLTYEQFVSNVRDVTVYTPDEQEEILHKNGW